MHTNGNGQGMNTDRFFSSSPGSPNSGCYDSGSGSARSECSGGSGKSCMSTAGSRWNTEAASGPIDSTDLSIIQDEMHTEALLYKKCAVYAGYFSDPRLKRVAETAAEHHRRHFDSLHGYLNSSN